jgi:hypothetical protein
VNTQISRHQSNTQIPIDLWLLCALAESARRTMPRW